MRRWRAWFGWGSLVAAFAVAQFHRVTPAAMGDAVMTDLGIGAGTFGLIVAMYFYSYVGLMVPGGALADRKGPRRVASIGCATAALGAVLFGVAQSPWSAALGRLLIGGGVAAAFPCVLRFQHDWLPSRMYGALTGVVVGVTTVASLVAYTPLALLVQAVGWLVFLTPPQVVIVPLLFAMGLAGGVIVTTLSAVSEVNPPQLAGVASGLVTTGGMAGAARQSGNPAYGTAKEGLIGFTHNMARRLWSLNIRVNHLSVGRPW